MKCYRPGSCGPYETTPCNECPYSKPQGSNREQRKRDGMDECKDCEKAPSHISKCFSETGYCKYFPYEMPECFGKMEDLRIPKGKVLTN